MSSFPRGGGGVSASRSVALDLMLRTFMNSSEFHSSRQRVWENVSRLVPGTTPQQCYERWEELRSFAGSSTNRDCSELTAYGQPVSNKSCSLHRQTNRTSRAIFPSPSLHNTTSPPLSGGGGGGGEVALPRAQSHTENSISLRRRERESQAAQRRDKVAGEEGGERGNDDGEIIEKTIENSELGNGGVKATSDAEREKEVKKDSSRESDMTIHVFDDQRKSRREFHCLRAVLVREMRYFSEYLSSEAQLWDEVDISVHCDIAVFDWLMRYTKRGLLTGPRGEVLEEPLEPPTLEPANVVSILISSDFLKMDPLVEECVEFCHHNLSAVLASPTNMACISDHLWQRLAAKFTPTELEEVVDKRENTRSKLFIHQIQKLFLPTHTHPQCPANASTLYRCRHCGKLLTSEQSALLPCTDNRLEVHFGGHLVWHHERDEGWTVSTYLSSLQCQHKLSPRNIYWRLWGVVNWLRCSSCGQVFQCGDLATCHYHPQPALSGRTSTGPPVHICCGSPPANVSPFPLPQSGCRERDHTVADPHSSSMFSLLLSHRDIVCPTSSDLEDRRRRDPLLGSHPSSRTAQLNFLKSADIRGSQLKIRNLKLTESSGERKEAGGGDLRQSRGGGAVAKDQGHGKNAVAMEMSLSARQRALSELSELEEDDEEERVVRRPHPPPLPLPPGAAAASRSGHRRDSSRQNAHRSSSVRRRHSSAPAGEVDWVWDSSKPQRWNQDRQRENDERRLGLLCDRLVHCQPVVPTSHTLTRLSSKERDSTSCAGGIFSQLEAQFRAQQTARAFSHQPPLDHNSTSKLPGRKR